MIKCIAIDDEPLALKQMVSYIDKTPFLTCVDSFDNALPALEFVQENKIDLIFADINLPDLNGMEFVKSLTNPPRVIFTTAYEEYALEGYKVDALDYLLKPIGYPDFLKSANKALKWFDLQNNTSTVNVEQEHFITVKSEHKLIRINYADIRFIEGMREYVRFHLENNKPVMTLLSMKKLETDLPDNFMRVHRSYIVNIDKVTTIEKLRILLDEKTAIPVGEQYKARFQEFVQRHFKV